MEEESIKFSVSKGIFYNPNMRFCRSVSSVAVGAIEENLEVVDAFCASGIRGLRYAKENKNVKKLTSIDIEKKAITLAIKNAKTNKIKKFNSVCSNISRAAFDIVADLVEIDPFGTPSPYLIDSLRFFNPLKRAYLSVTATDVAVLCGGKVAPCMKNYHSKPLNCEFTHEVGLRILIKRIAEVASEFNMGIEPLVSFSDRHYLKTVIKLTRSADKAYDSLKQLGYLSFCKSCGHRSASEFPQQCPGCGKKAGQKPKTEFAGPLWLGELHDRDFVCRMISLNEKRDYADKAQIAKLLGLLEGEIGLPPFYYSIHALCKLSGKKSVRKTESILADLMAKGFVARRTHFSDVSIKTDAPFEKVLEVL